MNSFSLIRRCDGHRYEFLQNGRAVGRPAFRRADGDYWITFDPDWGWCARLDDGTLAGLAWGQRPAHQPKSHPPEGLWISYKEGRSYLYDIGEMIPC